MVAEFKHLGRDQLLVVIHTHPYSFFMRAALERDMVVLFQSLVHNSG